MFFKRLLCQFWRQYSTKPSSINRQANLFSDPANELQQYLLKPLFSEYEKPFIVSRADIEKCHQTVFHPYHKHEIKFLKSAVNESHFPLGDLPEVIFIGHSNVGKSSLIKAIFERVPNLLVHVSKKYGRTKLLNFYQVGNKLLVVDSPGYGINQPKNFIISVEGYLKNRKNLKRIFFIVDATSGVTDRDKIAIEMLEEVRVPYALVMTKVDLAVPSTRIKNLKQLQQIRDAFTSSCCYPQPFLVSGRTLEGIGFLQTFIAYVTHNITIEGL